MDGILYKGRMINQDGARPSTGVEKELAGEGYQAFRGAPTLNVLALLGSMRRCRWGSELAPSLTWGSSSGRRPSHGYLKKTEPYYMPGAAPGTGEAVGSKERWAARGLHMSGRNRM